MYFLVFIDYLDRYTLIFRVLNLGLFCAKSHINIGLKNYIKPQNLDKEVKR